MTGGACTARASIMTTPTCIRTTLRRLLPCGGALGTDTSDLRDTLAFLDSLAPSGHVQQARYLVRMSGYAGPSV